MKQTKIKAWGLVDSSTGRLTKITLSREYAEAYEVENFHLLLELVPVLITLLPQRSKNTKKK